MEKKRAIRERYTKKSIDELGNVLKKYTSERCNALPILIEMIKRSSDFDKSVFFKSFGKFLNEYFTQFHPIDCKCFSDITSYYRPIYRKESTKKFRGYIAKYEDKLLYSYSMNVFKTFWKESFALKHQRENCAFIELKKKQNMKVIFLDIDGVLNNEDFFIERYTLIKESKYKKEYPYSEIDERCVKLLNELVEETGAEIVVSSSWRSDPDLQETFNKVGIKKNIFDKTPYSKDRHRGTEIQIWLNSHPEVENYVIIDDDTDMLDSQLNNFVCTDALGDGLNEKKKEECLKILNKNG